MRTVDNPKELFRQIDATDLGDDSYEFNVNTGQGSAVKKEVEFRDLSSEDLEHEAAHAVIKEAAIEVTSSDDIIDDVDAQFVADEDGQLIVYMCNTDRMGYEVVSNEQPKEGGYVCMFPEEIVKVVPAW